LHIADQSKVDETALRTLGARGFVRPSERALQVVLGPMADQVAGEIRAAIGARALAAPATIATPIASVGLPLDANALLAALGGPSNVRGMTGNASRLCIDLADMSRIGEGALRRAGVRSLARLDPHTVHLIVGAGAPATLAAMKLA
jgi:PTS system N-acetylglucosamine-specific IIC component